MDGQVIPGEDPRARLTHLEQALSKVSTLRHITAEYARDEERTGAVDSDLLPDAVVPRAWLWRQDMIDRIETSPGVRQVWLVSPDLEPDLSEPHTGKIVQRNLKLGKRYVYFYPADLPDAEGKRRRLFRNIGADEPKRQSRVTFVPLGAQVPNDIIPSAGNVIFFFKDDPEHTNLAFQEVVLNKATRRGSFWQECDRDHATQLCSALAKRLREGAALADD